MKIQKYILYSVLPYLMFSWILLTVVLFVQQIGRQSDIVFGVKIPSILVWQLAAALIPNVIAFTCPMACLIGVMIGLARLKSDSELVAIRASGVGNWQLLKPILILGVLLSSFSLFVNWKGVPFAAQMVRQVTLQALIAKLESPIELGQFNLDIPNYAVFVKNGDIEKGNWKNVFISNQSETGVVRLITAKEGNLNSDNEKTELLLSGANVVTFEKEKSPVFEKFDLLNFAIPSKRSELLKRLSDSTILPEELGLPELAQFVGEKTGKEKVEGELLFYRRITLSITPLIFVFLATSLSLRFSRGGRGFGIVLALIVLAAYYLCILFGEQMARTGRIGVALGSFLPIIFALVFGLFFFHRNKFPSSLSLPKIELEFLSKFKSIGSQMWNSRLLDFDILQGLFKYYSLTIVFFTLIYLIFTSFELWKFTANIENGTLLLGKYFVNLLPFVYSQIAASCVMLAILTTYTLKSRGNEVVTWISAGQSVYRLLLPALLFCISIGVVNWFFQETIVPDSNRRQEFYRSQIRNNGVSKSEKDGQIWIANDNSIFRFSPSDGKKDGLQSFVFTDENHSVLKTAVFSTQSEWNDGILKAKGEVRIYSIDGNEVSTSKQNEFNLAVAENPTGRILEKTSYLSSDKLSIMAAETDSASDKRNLEVGLQKKYSTLVLPLIVLLLISPFALSIHRRGKVQSVGYAIGCWLLFLAIISTFEQFGLNGSLSPITAIWSPLIITGLFGGFLLTRLKT
jgi:lipopolysaccharide export system permease protein